jgi:hypothetical protein
MQSSDYGSFIVWWWRWTGNRRGCNRRTRQAKMRHLLAILSQVYRPPFAVSDYYEFTMIPGTRHSAWVVDHDGRVPRYVWCKYGNLASTPRHSRAHSSRVACTWPGQRRRRRFVFGLLRTNIDVWQRTSIWKVQRHKYTKHQDGYLYIYNIPPGRNVTAVIYRRAAVGIYTQIYRINVIIKCVCVENKI